ncbi:hypothetical protein ES708_22265 [subsurface metagenome]
MVIILLTHVRYSVVLNLLIYNSKFSVGFEYNLMFIDKHN